MNQTTECRTGSSSLVDRFRRWSRTLTIGALVLVSVMAVVATVDLTLPTSRLLSSERYYSQTLFTDSTQQVLGEVDSLMWSFHENRVAADSVLWHEGAVHVLDTLAVHFPQLIGILIWETRNQQEVDSPFVVLLRDSIALAVDKLPDQVRLNNMWSQLKNPTQHRLAVSSLCTLPSKPYQFIHFRQPLDADSAGSPRFVRATLVLYNPSYLGLWYFLNLVLVLATLFVLRRVVELRPRAIMYFSLALASMLLAYILRVIPTAIVPFSPIAAHQAQMVLSMFVPLMPDIPFLILSALTLRHDTRWEEGTWKVQPLLFTALLVGYLLPQLPAAFDSLLRLTGTLGLLDSAKEPFLNRAAVYFLPDLISASAVVFFGWHLARSHHNLYIDTIGQNWSGKKFITVLLFLLFLPWAFVQLFYGWLPHDIVFASAFFTKAIALTGVVLYVLLQLFATTLEDRSAQINTARQRLRDSILGDAILIGINEHGEAILESERARMLHPKLTDQRLSLQEIVYYKSDCDWLCDILTRPDMSLYGIGLSLKSRSGRDGEDKDGPEDCDELICLVDLIPDGSGETPHSTDDLRNASHLADGSRGFTHLLIARPFDRFLFDSASVAQEFHKIRNHLAECLTMINWLKIDFEQLQSNDHFTSLEKYVIVMDRMISPAVDQTLRIDDNVTIICDLNDVLRDCEKSWGTLECDEKYKPNVTWPKGIKPRRVRARKRQLISIILDALLNVANKAERNKLDSKLEVNVEVTYSSTDSHVTLLSIRDSGEPFEPHIPVRFSERGPNIPLPSITQGERRQPKGLQWAYFFMRLFGGKLWVENVDKDATKLPTVFLQLRNME